VVDVVWGWFFGFVNERGVGREEEGKKGGGVELGAKGKGGEIRAGGQRKGERLGWGSM